MSSKAVQDELVVWLPNLRAFAISLCGSVDRADDLVQETLLKAWKHLGAFEEGTNLRAWLFTILRNTFLSDRRSHRDDISLDAGPDHAGRLSVAPEQYGRLDGWDMQRALVELSPDQRAAIILVGAEGFSYEETAAICRCKVGTVKSRVNRARQRLLQLLGDDERCPDKRRRWSPICPVLTTGEGAYKASSPPRYPAPWALKLSARMVWRCQ